MPRKTKAELAAEKEALENTEMEVMEPGHEVTPLPAEEEGPESIDTASLPEDEPQEATIAGLLADYSAASMEENEPEPQEKSPQEEEGEAASSANDSVSADSEPMEPPVPVQEEESSPENEAAKIPPAASEPEAASPRRGARERPAPHPSFFQTDFRALDRDLSPEQMQEWNSIYASYRSQSILTGEVTGVDTNTVTFQNPETGQTERRTIRSLVIISYRVKVIIPETEIWVTGEERPDHVTRSLVGAKVEYVILEVDRAGECAIASRKLAMQKQRRRFRSLHAGQSGIRVPCRVLVTGPTRCLLECGGFDIPCTQRDLSYTAIADLREKYRPGQELEAILKGFAPETGKPVISVKEVNPNPFDGAELRHPVGCRRQAVISGKYAGGIFCSMKDGVTCLCLYSNNHFDTQFAIGDTVLIHITRYDERRKLIYARILAKW